MAVLQVLKSKRKSDCPMKHSSTSIKDASSSLQEEDFHKFVRIRLRMFNLLGQYSPDDVVNECLIRWYTAVENGKKTPVLDGWMRSTAFNIVRELRRKTNKVDLYDPTILSELVAATPDDEDDEDDERRSFVLQALQTLSKKNQELLELRFFRNLSWDEVAVFYSSRGKTVSAIAARKRGQRALEELRKVFSEIL